MRKTRLLVASLLAMLLAGAVAFFGAPSTTRIDGQRNVSSSAASADTSSKQRATITAASSDDNHKAAVELSAVGPTTVQALALGLFFVLAVLATARRETVPTVAIGRAPPAC